MRKALGAAGLLALLVIPFTGAAGATYTKPTTKTVCAFVKAKAAINANANIGLSGVLLKKDAVNVNANALGDGDLWVKVCVTVDNVALTVGVNGLLEVNRSAKCDGIAVRVKAGLATGLSGGTVKIEVKAKVLADGTVVTDPAQLDADALIKAFGEIRLNPFTKLDGHDLAELELCVDAHALVDVGVDDGGDKK